MKIVIPMSGIGKRFLEAGYNVPKPLIEVEGKPIIEHIVNLFKPESDFIFICNDEHLRVTNMRQILESIVPDCKIYEVSVNNRKGPVDAIVQLEKYIDDYDEIIVSYCDYGTKWNYKQFLEDVRDKKADGSIACYKGFHPHMLGSDNYAFVKEKDMNMIQIQEKKPFTDNKMDEYASNGTYYFRTGAIMKKYFNMLIDKRISINNEYYVSMVYNLMVEDRLRIRIFEIEKMLQWGTPKDLEEYLLWSNYFLKRSLDFNKSFSDENETTLILPMAGAGSRFSIVGYKDPKPLLKIEGLPMIIQAVKCLPATKKQIFICQHKHLDDYDIEINIKKMFIDSNIIAIDYITQGQACTCEIGINKGDVDLDKPIIISACDNGVYYDITKYNNLLNDENVDVIIWSFSNSETSKLYPHMYAWLDVDEDLYIKRVSIKKPFSDCENKYCIIGTMTFKRGKYFMEGLQDIYKGKIQTNGEYYVDNMIESLIKRGYKCKIFNVENYLCWGTPNDYKTYQYWYEYFSEMNKI